MGYLEPGDEYLCRQAGCPQLARDQNDASFHSKPLSNSPLRVDMTLPCSARVSYRPVPGFVGKVPFERAPREPRRGVDRKALLAWLRVRLECQMRTALADRPYAAHGENQVTMAVWLALMHRQCAGTPRQARALLAGVACPPQRLRALCRILEVPTSVLTRPRTTWMMSRFLRQCFPKKMSSARCAKACALLARAPIWSEALFAQAAAIMQQTPDPAWIRQSYGAALLLQALDADVGVVRSPRRVPDRSPAIVELRMRGTGLQGENLRQHHQKQEEFCLQQLEADDADELRDALGRQASTAGVSPAS